MFQHSFVGFTCILEFAYNFSDILMNGLNELNYNYDDTL